MYFLYDIPFPVTELLLMAAVTVDGLGQSVQEVIAVLRPFPVPGFPLLRAVERGKPAAAVIEAVGSRERETDGVPL